MALGVYCECGRCLPVAEKDAGSSLTCSCGLKVVVPLWEEFRDCPLLLSAVTVERRVRRLLAEGILPGTAGCLRCGDGKADIVSVELECERHTVHSSGGPRFLIIPLPWGVHWISWREEQRIEVRGRDTDVSTPIILCAACHRQFHAPTRSSYVLLAVLLLAASGILGYFSLAIGIGTAAVGLVLLAVMRNLALRNWQRSLKDLLGKVPAYRQVLARHPWTVVVLPNLLDKPAAPPNA
jgi:hypothetical protein